MNNQDRLQHVAALAHAGDLVNLSAVEALSLIRALTTQEWRGGSPERMKAHAVSARVAAQRGRPQ